MGIILAESLVWLCLGTQVYHYAGYPLILALLARFAARPIASEPITPRASLLIAAYDEEAVIERKLRDSLALDYPDLEIIVNSEGSADGTAGIVAGFAGRGVIGLHGRDRRGKAAAMNAAVARASGEIVVFSDANAYYRPDALRRLVAPFADREVGCVSGRKVVEGVSTAGVGEGVYWKYEAWIKRLEGRLGSVSAVNGEMLAVRRADFAPIPAWVVNDDVYLMLRTIAAGRRVAFEPEAVCVEAASASLRDEAVRRERIGAGRYQLFFSAGLLPWRRPRELFMLVSHKLLRLLLPILMLLGLAANAAAVVAAGGRSPVMAVLLAGQLAFYGLAALGALGDRVGRRWRPAQIAWYFVTGHLGSLRGLVRFLRGRQSPLWARAEREILPEEAGSAAAWRSRADAHES